MHKRVIDILMDENTDLKVIAKQIAKSDPSVFVEAYKSANWNAFQSEKYRKKFSWNVNSTE
jgi:tRNA(Glu) U13 pseudouridine synthase TruD